MHPKIKNEHDLCLVLINAAKALNWVAYAETSTWDIVLVRDSVQIGVQAKMHANIHVLGQALPANLKQRQQLRPPSEYRANGPQYRTVLVPQPTRELLAICDLLKLWAFGAGGLGFDLLRAPEQYLQYQWQPERTAWTPDVVPEVKAGVSSPLRLTRWKQQALRLLAIARVRGFVTSADASRLGISLKTFTERHPTIRWMQKCGQTGRRFNWELVGQDRNRPDIQHPVEFEQYCAQVPVSGPQIRLE